MRLRLWIVPALLIGAAVAAHGQVVFGGNKNKQEKQDPTIRNLEGTVTGPDDQPVPKAIVQLKDMKSLQVRSFVASATGEYRFTGLKRDIDYEVKAVLDALESETKRLTVFDNRANARINLKLEKK